MCRSTKSRTSKIQRVRGAANSPASTAMRNMLLAVTAVAAVLAVTSAQAQQTIKIGVILAYSGQFADPSAQMDNGIKLYMKQYGDTVAGKKIELIRRDTGGSASGNTQ